MTAQTQKRPDSHGTRLQAKAKTGSYKGAESLLFKEKRAIQGLRYWLFLLILT